MFVTIALCCNFDFYTELLQYCMCLYGHANKACYCCWSAAKALVSAEGTSFWKNFKIWAS